MSQPRKHVAILGAGVQGVMLAYDLASAGHRVTLIEAAPAPGGLAGAMTLPEVDDLQVDRFYHCILSSDRHLMGLLEELGLKDDLRLTTTGMAFYGQGGGLHAMSTPWEFLTFPLVSLPARLRLALGLLYSAYGVRDGDGLESVPVSGWLRRVCGAENLEKLWGPLLASKFEGRYQDLPATYMWSRLKRMLSTRDKTSGVEQMGHLLGGYQSLIDALVERAQGQGAQLLLNTRVTGLERRADGHISGVHLEDGQGQGRTLGCDVAVMTVGNALAQRWLGQELPEATARPLRDIGYLAIVCPLLVLDRSLSPYYTINIVDRSLDMTGVIETTRIISPSLLGERHLVYLPYYCHQDSALLEASDQEIMDKALGELERILPEFSRGWILTHRVMRARATEPIHRLIQGGPRPMLPYRSGVPGVYLANSTQVYPDLVNCEAMAANVKRALEVLHQDLGSQGVTCLSKGR